MMSPETCLLLAVFTPLVAALGILALPRAAIEPIGYGASLLTALGAFGLLAPLRAGEAARLELFTMGPGLEVVLSLDSLGLTFMLLAAGLWVITGLYSAGYAKADHIKNQKRFFASFAASVGAAIGVAAAGNLVTFFLFYELLTLCTYPLVLHKESERAFAAARRYLAFSLGGGLALLTGIVWIYTLTGTTEFVAGGFLAGESPRVLTALFALLVAGVAVKAAVMPLHAWLPGAMVAPTPVSALLHAVAVVKAGVFGSMRVLGFVLGPEALAQIQGPAVLVGLTLATIVIGSLLALRQDNLKRRLAYSTIVHLSYIVLGTALVSPQAFVGSIVHMVNHGLAKITLFFCAGAIYAATHRENIAQLAGLGRKMPWTFGAFTLASLSLIGIPGLSGFLGKFYLARGAAEAGQLLPLFVMLGASLFTAAYLLPIVRTAYFDPPAPDDDHEGDVRMDMRVALLATSVLVVIFGVVPILANVQNELAAASAAAVFGGTP